MITSVSSFEEGARHQQRDGCQRPQIQGDNTLIVVWGGRFRQFIMLFIPGRSEEHVLFSPSNGTLVLRKPRQGVNTKTKLKKDWKKKKGFLIRTENPDAPICFSLAF